jgi:hypothetical protein
MRKSAAIFAGILLLLTVCASGILAATFFFQGFETDTTGWFDDSNGPPDSGSITREPSFYTNVGGYANAIPSAAGAFHARLSSTDCQNDTGPGTDCFGPFTLWGTDGSSSVFPSGGYVTEVAIYLDVAWAAAHPDVRFDWDSTINNNAGKFLSDFVFNAGTTPVNYSGGPGFVIGASPNAFRNSTFPENPCPDPGIASPPNTCRTPVLITTSGWYTFRHTFRDDGAGHLAVDLTILDHGGNPVMSWTIYQGFSISNVGGPAYGWFANEEIPDLPIDNSFLRSLQGAAISMATQAMEGNLKVKPGDTLMAGYDFTMPGNHSAATVLFTTTMVTFQAQCVTGAGGGTIVVHMPDSIYTDPVNNSQWFPSGDQHSPLTYQGSITVPDLCAGGQMILKRGGTFTAQVQSTDTTDKVNMRWHYSANGSSGSWSGTASIIPGSLGSLPSGGLPPPGTNPIDVRDFPQPPAQVCPEGQVPGAGGVCLMLE